MQFRFRPSRPHIGSPFLALLVAAYLLAVTNHQFWKTSIALFDSHALILSLLAVVLLCLFLVACLALSSPYVAKPSYILLIVIAVSGAWFMDRFGTIIDIEMIRSAVETTGGEASHLLTPAFVMHMVLWAGVPSLLIAWVRIDHRPFLAKLLQNTAIIVPCLIVAGVAFVAQAGAFISTAREHKEWLTSLNPVVPIGNAVKYVVRSNQDSRIVVKPLGTDARVADAGATRKPRVVVVVAGETARAENFSLGGYRRDTNPETARLDITYFPNTSSCGTITSVSLPCMFSVYPRADFTHRKGVETENLMDVLVHAGVKAEWWDNNTGSKGVADRIPNTNLFQSDDARFCRNGECLDQILLDRLDAWLDGVKGDAVLVMHQLGSHGPAYYLRYTDEYRRFTPDCRTAEFANCSRDEIVNAYDNSIAYTDHILAGIIGKLAARQDRIDPSMIYMSDHGESLGEYGLYLHGTPYFMAPSQQTHVPFILWLGAAAKAGVDASCLAGETQTEQSHDNLFHTVLGMMRIDTGAYDRDLDTLAPCRANLVGDAAPGTPPPRGDAM